MSIRPLRDCRWRRVAHGVAAVLLIAACSGPDGTGVTPPSSGADTTKVKPPVTDPDPAAHLFIVQAQGFNGHIMVNVGDTAPLTVTVTDSLFLTTHGYALTWSSSDPNIASVSAGGVVTAVAPGITTITASIAGKSDSRSIQVVQINLASFQLSIHATDDAGVPIAGGTVGFYYYGARPSDCYVCNVPFGGFVEGTTDATGAFTGSFVGDPEVYDNWAYNAGAAAAHSFAYVTVQHLPDYETDHRYLQGAPPAVSQVIHLHALLQATVGDSIPLTILATDPLSNDPTTSPGSEMGFVSRTFSLHVPVSGTVTVSAVPTASGVPAPYVTIEPADESDFITLGQGGGTWTARAGDVVHVQVATDINPGGASRSFLVRTIVAPTP